MNSRQEWKTWSERFKVELERFKRDQKLTDQDVAELISVSRASITHWKAGIRTPTLENFFNACAAIKADPEYVLFGRCAAQGISQAITNEGRCILRGYEIASKDVQEEILDAARTRIARYEASKTNAA